MENVTKEIIEFDPTSHTQLESLMENELFRPSLAVLVSTFFNAVHKLEQDEDYEGISLDGLKINSLDCGEPLFQLKAKVGYIIPE